MTDDIDIYRTANVLVELHGEDAPIQAAMKADALLEAGDIVESCVAMTAILKLPRATAYMRLMSICLLLCPIIDNLLHRAAHYVATNADHHDVEQ